MYEIGACLSLSSHSPTMASGTTFWLACLLVRVEQSPHEIQTRVRTKDSQYGVSLISSSPVGSASNLDWLPVGTTLLRFLDKPVIDLYWCILPTRLVRCVRDSTHSCTPLSRFGADMIDRDVNVLMPTN
jgi:hypothetical protein